MSDRDPSAPNANDPGFDPDAAADASTAPADVEGAQDVADAMTDELEALRRQVEEQRDRHLRLAAEYDNFRRRATKERAEATARGQAELAKQILEPLDDLSRFAHLDPAVVDAKTVVDGAAMVERKLLKALGNAGLEIINPLDQPFDPNLHEAVATEPAASREDDHKVARVYQVGYVFNGQLLRPARVVVKQWNG